jgi:hypothetical protein
MPGVPSDHVSPAAGQPGSDATPAGSPAHASKERDSGQGSGAAGNARGASARGGFQPRVEAEEGEPTRFDFVVLALVVAFLVVAILWALGVVHVPGIGL